MPSSYPADVRQQVVSLARSGTRVAQLAETFGCRRGLLLKHLELELLGGRLRRRLS
jgi:transposase-like protein